MKSTGIVRKVDELGRIVLPIELRRTMNIEVKDSLEIYQKKVVDGNNYSDNNRIHPDRCQSIFCFGHPRACR